jgi:Ca2+-transporting ATPase
LQSRGLFTGIRTNRILLLTLSVSFLAQLGLIYIPLLQHIFQTEALGFRDLGVVLSLASLSFAGHEVRRHYERLKERESMGRGVVEALV